MTFREFFGVARARWRIIVLSLLIVVGAAALTTLMTAKVYGASAKVYFQTDTPSSSSNRQVGTYVITRQDLNTYIEVLSSPAVMSSLVKALDLPPGSSVNVTAEVSETSNMLTFTSTGGDPVLAARVANTAGPVLAAAAQDFSPLLALNHQTVTSQPITPAVVPTSPISPDPKRNLALGFVLGLIAGLGLALIRHTLDTKVRAEADLKLLSDRPIIGNLPMAKGAAAGELLMQADPRGIYAEAIRRLRTNLLFVDVTTGGHSFVVTSSVPGEGKTTTAISLALAMADSNSRVLLIDGDLRNPSVAKAMGLEGGVGLTTVLLGKAEPTEVVQQWGQTSLFVLPAGQMPPNPSELLGSEPMAQLFAKLAQDFDFILVDSPPIVPVIDAILINKLTHGLIMVVAADRTRKRDLASAIHSLNTVDVPIAGFSLNLVSPRNASSAYRYGYYGQPVDSRTKGGSRERRSRRRRDRAVAG